MFDLIRVKTLAATSGAAYTARCGRRAFMRVPIRLVSFLFLFGGLILLRAAEPSSAPSVVTRLLYDADGQRVGKQTVHWDSDEQGWRTNLTRFLIDAHHPSGYAQRLAEAGEAGRDASGGGGDRGYLYGLHPIAEVDLERVSYALVDGHHSVRGQVDPGGDFAGQQGYDAFGCALGGKARSIGEVDREAAGYAGEFTDPSSGLQDLRARQYEPGVGRFRTMDSYEGQREVPAGLHKYLYCHDDPVNGKDPSGHFFDSVSTLFSSGKQFALQTRNAVAVEAGRSFARRKIAETVATTAILAIQWLPLGEIQTDDRGFEAELLYRSMVDGGGAPRVGDDARSLGVRSGVDISAGSTGLVMPGTGGMSVAPRTPMNLPAHRRPRILLGTGKDAVWGISALLLGSDLTYRQDSPTHGQIEPAIPMPLQRFQEALSATRDRWIKVVAGN